jgi:hypothetical protein
MLYFAGRWGHQCRGSLHPGPEFCVLFFYCAPVTPAPQCEAARQECVETLLYDRVAFARSLPARRGQNLYCADDS